MLLLLFGLTTRVFDGALFRETLSQIVQVYILKSLELRAHD